MAVPIYFDCNLGYRVRNVDLVVRRIPRAPWLVGRHNKFHLPPKRLCKPGLRNRWPPTIPAPGWRSCGVGWTNTLERLHLSLASLWRLKPVVLFQRFAALLPNFRRFLPVLSPRPGISPGCCAFPAAEELLGLPGLHLPALHFAQLEQLPARRTRLVDRRLARHKPSVMQMKARPAAEQIRSFGRLRGLRPRQGECTPALLAQAVHRLSPYWLLWC